MTDERMNELAEAQQKLISPDEESRRQAVELLARLPLDQAIGLLSQALGDPSWRVRKDAVAVVLKANPSEAVMVELVNLLRSHDNAGLRNSAVECLEKLGPAASEVLPRFLADPDHDVRKFVVDIMGVIAVPAFVAPLMDAMDDPDPNVSAAAVENLGKIGDPRAVPALVAALEKPDVWLRHTVIEALGHMGHSVPLDAILPFASDPLLKKPVLECLGILGGPESLPVLLAGLSDRVRTVREAAAHALCRLRGRLSEMDRARMEESLLSLKGSPAVEGLVKSFSIAEGDLKESLLVVLALIGDERGAVLLLDACQDERLLPLALQAFRTMGEAGSAVLRELYPSSDDERRALILYLCAEAGSCQVTELVADGLVSDYPPLRRVATEAVGKLGLSRYADRVALLLGDGVDFVADGAVGALKRLVAVDRKAVEDAIGDQGLMTLPASRRHAARLYGTLGDVERLLRLLKDEDAAVRKEAVTALASLRTPSATSHLLMTMVDEDPDVRIAVLESLGDLGDGNLLEPLSLALQDEDPWVVCAALRSLARCCGGDALEPIMALMDKAEGVVLITALEALGSMGGERVLAALLRSLSHPDAEVVKAAMEILAGLDTAWISEYQAGLLGNPNWDVRATYASVAVQCLGAGARSLLEEALASEHDAMVRQKMEGLLDSIR